MPLPRIRSWLPSLIAALALCAARPALAAGESAAPNGPGDPLLPARRVFHHHRPITSSYDSATAMTDVRLLLDGGRYFLWTERPRIEVTFRYAGAALAETPDSVEIHFRTQSPQFANTNRLTLETGDSLSVTSTTAVASSVRQHVGHVDHVLTFHLTLPQFARVLQAPQLTFIVGDLALRLKPDQLEALRDLGSRMAPPGQ